MANVGLLEVLFNFYELHDVKLFDNSTNGWTYYGKLGEEFCRIWNLSNYPSL
jgi:hypothetical protein